MSFVKVPFVLWPWLQALSYYRSGVLPPLEQLVAADERGAATRLPPLSAAPPNVCRSLQAPPFSLALRSRRVAVPHPSRRLSPSAQLPSSSSRGACA